MAETVGLDSNDRGPSVEVTAPDTAQKANMDSFLTHDFAAVRRYRPDVAALRSCPTRTVLVGGSGSRGLCPHRCTSALAALLGAEFREFPGGHGEPMPRPAAFAAGVRSVVSSDRSDELE